jgi:ubiquinone biosynthesis monooxygenase Coq7
VEDMVIAELMDRSWCTWSRSFMTLRIRLHSLRSFAHKAQSSAIYLDPLRRNDLSVSTSPEALTAEQQRTLDSAIRVDQAGEVAANWIYKGQLHVLRRDQIAGPLIQVGSLFYFQTKVAQRSQEMWDQEKKHLEVMDKLQLQHEIRPTVLLEVAKLAGFGLGAATALMGREAAMACTEAVETVIGEHYDEYVEVIILLLY